MRTTTNQARHLIEQIRYARLSDCHVSRNNPCPSQTTSFYDTVVEIQLTEDDYRANEEALSVSVSVTKTAPIARDLVLTVSPVTLAEARQLNSFPEGVETPDNNNGRSPVDAGSTM